ncbi:pseudaminic acid synthase [bacterium]|nr:pseudaminic acid synthase [bacterium]
MDSGPSEWPSVCANGTESERSPRLVHTGQLAIGASHPPFVIAEMSGNHNQSLERALQLVEAAAQCGAHALKLQTYTAETITLDVEGGAFKIDDPSSPWHGQTLHQLYRQACTPWEWHEAIFRRGRQLGLVVFSSPFDESAVDFLESLDCPCYKIASFENVHLPLIRKASSTGKPLILSTGLAHVGELQEAVQVARSAGCQNLTLLKCTSAYPAQPSDLNLRTIPHMRDLFGVEVGLSDHTLGHSAALAAVALGATVIEKHLTLRRSDGGVDSTFSLEPHEMAELVQASHSVWEGMGGVFYGPTAREINSLQFRRSLYISADLRAGQTLDASNVRVVRPGLGLHPRYLDTVLGRKVTRDVSKGTPVQWDIL